MTTTEWPNPALPESALPPVKEKAKMRKFTWVIIGFNLLMAAWLVYGLAAAGHQMNGCASDAYQDACETGTSIGTGVVVFGLVAFTAFVDMILGVVWMVTGRSRQN